MPKTAMNRMEQPAATGTVGLAFLGASSATAQGMAEATQLIAVLNGPQALYIKWTEQRFSAFLDLSNFVELSAKTRRA